MTRDVTCVLLCFHQKGQLWVQLGGHVEPGDDSVAAAAYREAWAGSGLAHLVQHGMVPVDLSPTWRVDEIVLVSCELGAGPSGRARYEILRRFPLAAVAG